MTNKERLEKLAARHGLEKAYIYTRGKGCGYELTGAGYREHTIPLPYSQPAYFSEYFLVGYYPSLSIALEQIPKDVAKHLEKSEKARRLLAEQETAS